jgi:hypothetical protein
VDFVGQPSDEFMNPMKFDLFSVPDKLYLGQWLYMNQVPDKLYLGQWLYMNQVPDKLYLGQWLYMNQVPDKLYLGSHWPRYSLSGTWFM